MYSLTTTLPRAAEFRSTTPVAIVVYGMCVGPILPHTTRLVKRTSLFVLGRTISR